ncbi:hypothetical protein COW94_00155 [Candidatus Peregrinibacteria bacterium CG22_combo_CG10-13_8_21_14_all_44_10]|nr:MAG: hypothetical protein AUK45_01295 [Candidatus Peregrinibacteria bacterium CG2_30_44_17]PIP66747.1 MAG: hypothetical protein COW94_00155 [Candidatus Peregrinibacteria bacterium CG22_combo_CG10-13_8_21_14_all_44_10]PIS03954.1 MAG: hypothetical protein COT83_03255 [Candidatus Peregrinibacteria bacterium CG10_big_fil_rev_8_21_14_0_10_44_7]PJB89667.1 MAG: hypothetical protein CO082_00195 [Candidatus Peregrinibacteria bacterium CG_4_9_14_0_8_um_filter_44_15]
MPYFQIFLLIASVWAIGRVFRQFNWPPLFGEILAGIIVGPVVLGVVEESEAIKVMAELGIFFLMLHAGLETSPKDLFKASKRAVLVGVAGVVLPFALGLGVSHLFGYSFTESLFIAMGLSITAIAVSAKLFKDYAIMNSRVAHITMGAAIIDDILGLILFSVVLSIAEKGHIDAVELSILIGKIVAFFGIVLFLGKRFFRQLNKVLYAGNKAFTFTIIVALGFGLVAEAIGLHIIIGAFLAGLFLREEIIEVGLFNKIEDRVYGLSYSLFGPIFFASLAFHLDFSAFKTAALFTVVVILVATLGKIVGCGLAARMTKLGPKESLGIGLAMNSRGAVELIIASIGLEYGVIGTEVFSVLVVMAFATTIISIIGLKPLVKYLPVGTADSVPKHEI